MDSLIGIACSDGSCCCLPPRSTVAFISILSMLVCTADLVTSEKCDLQSVGHQVDSLRMVLTTLFHFANILLLTASIVENPFLINVYVCSTLAFIVMSLCAALAELLCRYNHEGVGSLLAFCAEVAFIFVISRCLPLVDTYRRHLITKI